MSSAMKPIVKAAIMSDLRRTTNSCDTEHGIGNISINTFNVYQMIWQIPVQRMCDLNPKKTILIEQFDQNAMEPPNILSPTSMKIDHFFKKVG